MIVLYAAIFARFLCSFEPPFRTVGTYLHLERGGMPFHDRVGINCKKGATTEVKAQEPSIWAKGVYGG